MLSIISLEFKSLAGEKADNDGLAERTKDDGYFSFGVSRTTPDDAARPFRLADCSRSGIGRFSSAPLRTQPPAR